MSKSIVVSLFVVIVCELSLNAQNTKLFQGFDGGMMVHTGYLHGGVPGLEYDAEGMPAGIGGVIRLNLGNHVRVGSEGYVSTLKQNHNGSYIKYGWGGILADACFQVGSLMPYAGLTIGGGSVSYLLMFGEQVPVGQPIENSYHHSVPFLAIDPFIGCDYIVSDAFHLTLKADWLQCVNQGNDIPTGPRLYLGFIFYH